MDTGIAGKNALVMASSKGLGLGVAQGLAAEGTNVFLCGRNTQRLAQASKDITALGQGKALYTTLDMQTADAAVRLYNEATQSLGRVDIVINNCGGPPSGGTTDFESEMWRTQFETLFMRIVEITNLCLPAMRSTGWGRVITLGSSGVQQPIPNLALSNSLRSALVGWTKTLATECASNGVTVNMLLPGRIMTDRLAELDQANAKKLGISQEQVQKNNMVAIPAGRYGRVDEFAAAAVFLASVPASYITGTMIRCDGGAIAGV